MSYNRAVTPLSRPAKGMTKLANMGRCVRCLRDRDRDLDLDLERVLDLGMDQSLPCRSEVRMPN